MPAWSGEHPADPKRRLRRHRYQEGPGFLFLATEGGRPAQSAPKASWVVEVRQRMRAVRLAAEVGLDAALAEGCSRRSVFRWCALFKAGGIEALIPQSRARRRPQAAVPDWVSRVIVAIRLATYWNSKRIAAEMERRQIYKVGHTYIDELFKQHGCSRGSVAPTPGPRYERSQPNELWHIDIKGPFFIQLGRGHLKTWLFGLVDDHSRFLIGLQIHTDAQAAPVLKWLEECFELCGKPLQLMSDNGNPFVVWMPGVLTRFGKRLRDLNVRHLRTQISTPWTNGKIEAFWEVLQREVLDRQWFSSLHEAEAALRRFGDYYNFHRLSGTLGWQTPAERYLGTPFTDRGFEHIPALEHLQPWLEALMATAA